MVQFCKKNGLFNILLFPLHAPLWLCHRLPVTTHLARSNGRLSLQRIWCGGWWWCWTFITEPLIPPGTQDLILSQMLCIFPHCICPWVPLNLLFTSSRYCYFLNFQVLFFCLSFINAISSIPQIFKYHLLLTSECVPEFSPISHPSSLSLPIGYRTQPLTEST